MDNLASFLLYGDSRPPKRSFRVGEVGMACKLDSLPFPVENGCLGRDFQSVAPGFSTFSGRFTSDLLNLLVFLQPANHNILFIILTDDFKSDLLIHTDCIINLLHRQ